MGFWHTGYIEFHEPIGLGDYVFDPSPPEFPCVACGQSFESLDELRRHRFERHALRRPALVLRGREVGANRVVITEPPDPDDIVVADCDRGTVNGQDVPLSDMPRYLSDISSDVCRVTLTSAEISSEFILDFRIASQSDLQGIEEQFERTALGRRLDSRAIDEFIASTRKFHSAISYCDGICSYLYGVLAKERAADSSLPYDAYVGKFTRAAEELSGYNRSLARSIGALIEFHFNHFREAAALGNESRIGFAAKRYQKWLRSTRVHTVSEPNISDAPSALEALLTDWETEQIVRWAVRPLPELSAHSDDIRSLLKQEISEYDRAKLSVLLAETYSAARDFEAATQHARPLRNLPTFDKWAESIISNSS